MSFLLEARNLTIGYDAALATDLNFEISKGDCIALMGANGCGKSTLLKTLAGLLSPLLGAILIEGREISAIPISGRARFVSVVLTRHSVPMGMKVIELLKLGRIPYLNLFGNFRVKDMKVIEEVIDLLAIRPLKDELFENLSDGQKQKVMIGRALVQEAPLLILDEPTTFLDVAHRIDLMKLVNEIAQERKIGVIYSSHDWDLVLALSNLLWILKEDGALEQGMPEELLLRGVVENVFARDMFQISMETGQFIHSPPILKGIRLIDDDFLRKYWVSRALEKNGYFQTEEAAIVIAAEQMGWKVDIGDRSERALSLRQLLSKLQAH